MFTQFFSKFFSVLVAFTLIACEPSKKPLVTITQIAPHPSLDAIRQGILDELKEQNQDVEIVFDNAQGNIALAVQIAEKQASLSPKVMVSITTPSTQAVYNTARKHGIPVVFSAVSDPGSAKLIDPATHKGKGISGVSDLAPVEQQLELILKIQPHLKKLGILYNAGEANSIAVVAKFKNLAAKKGIEIIEKTAMNTQEVSTAASSFIGQVEAIYIPNDNTIISSLPTVLKTIDNKIPVYSSDPESVQRGCIATATFGQYQIGRETGKMLVAVLNGTPLEELPVKQMEKVEVFINSEAAKKLSIEIPKELQQSQKN